MDIEEPLGNSTHNDEAAKPIRCQGIGGLLLLIGAGLVASDSSMKSPTVGGGLGVLLLIVGAGLLLRR